MTKPVYSAFATDQRKAASPYDILNSMMEKYTTSAAVAPIPKTPDVQTMYSAFNPAQVDALKEGKQIGLDGTVAPGLDAGGETPWYQDGSAMQGYAGLASAATNMALMIPQFKAYRQNLKESKHNLARAREDAKMRDTMRSNLNAATTTGATQYA